MRCKNCGWENPANNTVCEKCHTPLTGVINDTNTSKAPENLPSEKFEPQKTTECCPECGYPVRDNDNTCPHCGFSFNDEQNLQPAPTQIFDVPNQISDVPIKIPEIPSQISDTPSPVEKTCLFCKAPVSETAHFCLNCGVALTDNGKNMHKTIKPWVHAEQIKAPECSLTFISGEGEPVNDSSLRFSGNVIELNRGNTEPANQTITSKAQAELSFENDKWYIQDKSALKTTYIHAGEKKELKPGEIIVLGNRSFQFNCV